jgi:hypothetical protein
MKRLYVRISVNGNPAVVLANASVAAALASTAVGCFHRSPGGEPRLPLCGMGVCFECRVTIDSVPCVRACMTPVREGMQVRTCA